MRESIEEAPLSLCIIHFRDRVKPEYEGFLRDSCHPYALIVFPSVYEARNHIMNRRLYVRQECTVLEYNGGDIQKVAGDLTGVKAV